MPAEVESKTDAAAVHWQAERWMNKYSIQIPDSFQLCLLFSSFIRTWTCLLPINLYRSSQRY
jgi:hypothetical protein